MSRFKLPMPTISRLAPTPSGYLHIGNAYSFVLTALLVKSQKGLLHLRIDDIDAERSRTEFFEDIFSQIDWLEIEIDRGASGVDDFKTNYSQHLRLGLYESYIDKLIRLKKVFACECSRSQVAAASPNNHIYPGTCRNKNLDLFSSKYHLRYNTHNHIVEFTDLQIGPQKISLQDTMGDFTVKRKGGLPAYQIVSVVDDIQNNINLIVRGEDLLNSTAAQIQLSQNFDHNLALKAQFLHHPLLSENKESKLSKSHGSLSIQKMRENGTTKAQIYDFLAKSYGFKSNKVSCFKEMLEEFQQSELKLGTILGIQI